MNEETEKAEYDLVVVGGHKTISSVLDSWEGEVKKSLNRQFAHFSDHEREMFLKGLSSVTIRV